MRPTKEIDTELVQWARANLPNIPESQGEFYDRAISGMLVKPGKQTLKYETLMKQRCADYDRMSLNHFPSTSDFMRASREFARAQLLGRSGQNVRIERPFRVNFGYNISVGENFYADFGCVFLDWSVIRIGDNVSLGPKCTLTCVNYPPGGKHGLDAGIFAHPITIKDNVWIGANVVVLSGVTIGENAVVGAGSVITEDVPPAKIVAGNPARVIGDCVEEEGLVPFQGP